MYFLKALFSTYGTCNFKLSTFMYVKLTRDGDIESIQGLTYYISTLSELDARDQNQKYQ